MRGLLQQQAMADIDKQHQQAQEQLIQRQQEQQQKLEAEFERIKMDLQQKRIHDEQESTVTAEPENLSDDNTTETVEESHEMSTVPRTIIPQQHSPPRRVSFDRSNAHRSELDKSTKTAAQDSNEQSALVMQLEELKRKYEVSLSIHQHSHKCISGNETNAR